MIILLGDGEMQAVTELGFVPAMEMLLKRDSNVNYQGVGTDDSPYPGLHEYTLDPPEEAGS